MKKVLSLVLAAALLLCLSAAVFAEGAATAQPSAQRFTLDGERVTLEACNIDGYNYVQLRRLAELFNGTDSRFSVSYDARSGEVRIVTGENYDGDGTASPSPDEADAVKSAQTIVVDGETVEGLSVWNIAGYNYFRLAELAGWLGFGLGYDAATDTAAIRTGGREGPAAAESYADVYAALTARGGAWNGGWVTDEAEAVPEDAEAPAATGNAAADGDYSGTNVQVAGIDEGDIVKTDGEYIYVLNGDDQLTVIKAGGADSAVVSRTVLGYSRSEDGEHHWSGESKYPREMFVSGGVLAVVSNYYSYEETYFEDLWKSESENYTCVDFYDVSDPANPALVRTLGQDGALLGSRLLDGRLYLVTRYWVWDCDEDDPGTFVPCVYDGGEARAMAADCVYIGGGDSAYVVACAYDLASGALTASRSLLGGGDEIYMNAEHLYVFGSKWERAETAKYTESVYTVTEYRDGSATEIARFDLADGLTLAASGRIPGYLESQFSADEYDGYLRLVATRNESSYKIYEDETYGFQNYVWGDSGSATGLYILDAGLNVVGSVTDLAPGEQIYSARFDGTVAYFCTFRTVDPLFAVDCGDPANPRVLSALKISGFSEYLHPWTEGKLFGFGREADEDTGRTGGLKLVMFDTADKTDVTVERTYALDESYSEALYNHRAFFIVPAKNIIGFAGDGDYYIFSYDESAGFRLLRRFDFEKWAYGARGLYIGDYAYVVGGEELMVLDMNTWDAPVAVRISAAE